MESLGSPQDGTSGVLLTAQTSHKSSSHCTRTTSWETGIPASSEQKHRYNSENFTESLHDIDLGPSSGTSESGEPWNTVENITALGLSFGADDPGSPLPISPRFSLDEQDFNSSEKSSRVQHLPFDKWLKNLHWRAVHRRQTLSGDVAVGCSENEAATTFNNEDFMAKHKKSHSDSSFGFVTAVKSASISLASLSMAPRSRRTAISSRHLRADRSSKASNTGIRYSEDGSFISRNAVMDEAVAIRAMQRRRVLEEIISSEESYVGDIKFLMNVSLWSLLQKTQSYADLSKVYVTLLASIPTISLNMRSSINSNLTEIVELHEELLGDLHRVVPHSEYTQPDITRIPIAPAKQNHQRWRSLDAAPGHKGDLSWLQKVPGLTADAVVAAEVAKVFGKKV